MGTKLGMVVSFVSGLAVGWLLGIFSAPSSGKETLDNLGEVAIELRGKAEDTAVRVKDQVLGPRPIIVDSGAEEAR